jgi:hypothetical protein
VFLAQASSFRFLFLAFPESAHQPNDEDDQEDEAKAAAADGGAAKIKSAAAEQEEQDDDKQEQVHTPSLAAPGDYSHGDITRRHMGH